MDNLCLLCRRIMANTIVDGEQDNKDLFLQIYLDKSKHIVPKFKLMFKIECNLPNTDIKLCILKLKLER